MNTKNVLNFLAELKENNHRDWFLANKKRHDTIKKELQAFLENLISGISTFDHDIVGVKATDCMFRINRDVRFSNDKSPYKTHIGAFITKTGRKGNHPGYYIHFEPGQSFFAGGLYMPPPPLLKAVRDEIYFNVDEFLSIINEKEFIAFYPKLDDFDKLMRPPKGYDANWEHIELLKYKSYIVSHMLGDEVLYNASLPKQILEASQIMFRFNHFLQQARLNLKDDL